MTLIYILKNEASEIPDEADQRDCHHRAQEWHCCDWHTLLSRHVYECSS